METPTFQRRDIHPAIVQQCSQIFFRQSLIKDYLECPQMTLYRWVLNLDARPPWLSATLGTAGHKVVYTMHETRKFDYNFAELQSMLEVAFRETIAKDGEFPQIPKGCETIEDAFARESPEYLRWLLGYQYHPRNREFHSTMHEQSFVLEVPSTDPNFPPYLFTGQIDQGGPYDNGEFAIRDMKFRDNNLRPSKTELDLDVQATVYATAIKYGNPACDQCKPKYTYDEYRSLQEVKYSGPCETCKAKIGTPYWPQRFANMFELVWMRDFDIHTEDQYPLEIADNTKPKIPNPKGKGPPIYPRIRNPKYDDGYKKDTYKGPGFLLTIRPPSSLATLMSDVIRICDEIRKGTFYRRPGDACNFFCGFKEQCLKGLELEIQEANLQNVSAVGTEDPW